MPGVDDTALRTAAAALLGAARQQLPGVAMAAHAVEQQLGTILIEVAIGPDGPGTTTLLFDRGGDEQAVLLEVKRNGRA